MADFCSLSISTDPERQSGGRPLDLYRRKGYVVGGGDEAKALDAAVALTASTWGPPMATGTDEADGVWWMAAYDSASCAVERAIVNALVGDPGA